MYVITLPPDGKKELLNQYVFLQYVCLPITPLIQGSRHILFLVLHGWISPPPGKQGSDELQKGRFSAIVFSLTVQSAVAVCVGCVNHMQTSVTACPTGLSVSLLFHLNVFCILQARKGNGIIPSAPICCEQTFKQTYGGSRAKWQEWKSYSTV